MLPLKNVVRHTGHHESPLTRIAWKGYSRGLILTFILAIMAQQLASLPFLSVVGTLVLAILLGMGWRAVMDIPAGAQVGITFSTKKLLRAGIILMGVRLDLQQIWASGLQIVTIDVLVIVFTLIVMIIIGQRMKLPRELTVLTAVGTAVCGASAILAVAPLVRAKQDTTALAVSFIAVMGMIGALAYSFLYPILPYDPTVYGILTGATLHEVGHVVAAGAAGGAASEDMAVLVKLGRVALLIPVAIAIGIWFHRKHSIDTKQEQTGSRWSHLPIPWFIFGFLAMSAVNSFGWLSDDVSSLFLALSGMMLAMAMAGIGLGVSFQAFRTNGKKGFIACFAGSVALVAFGVFLVPWLCQ